MKRSIIGLGIATAALLSATALQAQAGELIIESWRTDDLSIWQDQIIPAFNKVHPNIKVTFSPTAPTQYNAAVNAKLEGGGAGDLITCRPFDQSLSMFKLGNLADITDLDGLQNFPQFALAAWSTDDGSKTFCVPMASVIHGFIYNKDAFVELGISVPKTETEFFAALDKIKEDGSYSGLAMGTADQWEAATMGYTNIGPNYWKGEEGRNALISGKAKLTDPEFVGVLKTLAAWKDYLPAGFEAMSYPDSQNLFTLGRAAIYPAGSWEIAGFEKDADFAMGAFAPPVANAGDTCYISDHVDIGLGMNAKSKNPEEAKTFLKWVTSSEFAGIYSNALPGFFSLSNHKIELTNALSQEFVSWRGACQSTIRVADQILSRGTPNTSDALWGASVNVINGTATPEAAADKLQKGLAGWFAPQQ
ncbi:MAG: carbohydrate ABC transporter substrate-binding protein [Cohaesibacteraceae bacterium]|nr:carbohydrate ABC transporter substrate-binding protein [Cohaesibacteraceae bacterium]